MILAIFLALIASSPGESGYNYVKLPVSPLNQLLGSSYIAYDGPLSFIQNPALDKLSGRFAGSITRYVADIYCGTAGYALGKDFAVALFFLNSGKMAKINEFGEYEGDFSSTHMYLTVSRNFLLKGKHKVGVNVKVFYQNIDTYNSLALGFDLGYIKNFGGKTSLGLTLRNIGYEFKPFEDEKAKLPMLFEAGLYHSFSESFRAGLGVETSSEKTLFSFFFMLKLYKTLDVGLGYNSLGRDWKTGQGSDILKGLTLGSSLLVRGISLSYSFTPTGEMGDIHRIGISYRFK